MNKIIKFAGFVLAGLIGLLVLIVIILKIIPDNQYKSWISSAVESSTGRSFSIGSLDLDFGTSLRIGADKMQLGNASWADKADMLSVNHLDAELKLIPLFSGRAELFTHLDTANIIAESNPDGVSNWALGNGAPEKEKPEEITDEKAFSGLPIRPIIRELRIEGVNLTVADGATSVSKNLTLNSLLIETPELETSLSLNVDVNGVPVTLNGGLGNIDSALDQVSTPLNLNGKIDENKLNIAGEWGPMLPETNLNLLLDIQVPSTSSVAALAGYEIDDFGVLEFTARARATDGLFSIEDVVTKLDGKQTSTSITGGIANLAKIDGIDMGIKLDTERLHRLVTAFNIELPIPLPPTVQLSAQVRGGKDGLGIEDIDVIVRDEGVELKLTGAVSDLLGARQVDAQLLGDIDSLSHLSKYAKMELPALGAIKLSGDIQSEGEAIGLNALNLGLTAENLTFNVSGGIANLLTVGGINAKADADITSLTQQNISELATLLKSFGVELPVEMLPQSIKLSTGIQGNLEQLTLMDISAKVLDQDVQVSMLGAVDNVLGPSGIAVNLTLNSDSIASFSKYAGTELPDLGPLEANARVVSSDETYSLDSMSATLDADIVQADVTASIADLLMLSGINADVTANTPTLASLSDLAQTELPDTDPVKIHATLKGENLENTQLDLNAQSAGVKVAVNTAVSLLNITEDLKLDVSVKAENLEDFEKFAQMELPDRGPLDFNATVSMAPRAFDVNGLSLSIDDQSATGDLTLRLPEPGDEQGVTLLHGQLDAPYIDLSPFLVNTELEAEEQLDEELAGTPTATEAAETVEPEEDLDTPLAESDRLLSSDPVLFELLHDYDIDLSVNGTRLNLGQADIRDLQIKVLLKDGLLNITPIKGFGSTGGTIDGMLQIDGRSTIPTLDTDIILDSIPMPNLGGTADLHLNIDGQGQSVAALMASLNGQFIAAARDGVIPKSFASRFGKGLMSFSSDKDTSNLECLILRVDIKDGVANFKNKLAAQLTEVTWRGGGTIDFNTERLSADIAPKPRKGIPVSLTGGFAGLVKLGGTLKNPQLLPDYSDAAFKYGKYSAYVATGGLSLLAEIIHSKVNANKDICEQILDGTVFEAADKVEKKNLPK